MSGTGSIGGLDSSVLLGYYQAQLSSSPSALAAANAANQAASAATGKTGATAKDSPPWEAPQPAQTAEDAKVLSTTNFLDTSNVPLTTSTAADSKTEQDNQKLFSLYTAMNTLAYIAKMGQRSDTTTGQLAGLNARFQTGLAQVESYINSASFNNFTLQAAQPTSSVTSTATIPFSSYTYGTRTLTSNANLNSPLSGLSPSQSFTIAIKKGGTTSDLDIDLSQVQGPLTLTNVISYINQQLSAGGFTTRFQRTQSGGTATDLSTATYGLQISPGANETVSLSAPAATPSLYLVGNSGSPDDVSTASGTTTTNSAADQSGRLVKLTGLDSAPQSVFSVNQPATTGTSTASATAVDANGNVYVIGAATGNFGNQINQGSADSYLTKYDSAGNVVWSKLLGSAGSASGYSLALDPSGGIVVAGSTTADLTTTAVADGNTDTFAARYDSSGNQTWIKQIQTLAGNQPASVSVDASGSIYIGGQVSGGVIGSGQTASGKSDGFLVKLDAKGNIVAENQFGTSAADSVGATATGSDGSLYVASVQNGHAIVAKYAGGDITSAPVWQQDLGDLQSGGAIGGLAVSNGQVYVSGTTSNPALTASGAASVAVAGSGGTDAFVFTLGDAGTSASPETVSYVGTAGSEKGGAVTVGPDGTVYLTGTTTGTFAGQQRNIAGTNNLFAAALGSDGTLSWTRQYGGADGQSTGAGIAVDTQGSSVLDALGLPRGTITLDQSVDLTSMTTLRAGDSFQIQFQGTAARTATITIDKGETIQSLASKINIQLQTMGKAKVNYTGAAEGLQIAVNPGVTLSLVAGPADFDALSRLGIAPGILTNPGTTGTATASTSSATPAYGLGLGNNLDISTKTGADLARSGLLGVLSSIQSAYQKSNAPPASTATPSQAGAPPSNYQQSQLANYNLALSLLGGSSSTASSGSGTLSLS